MAIKITEAPKSFDYIPLTERGEQNPFTVTIQKLPPKQFTILEDKMAKINQDESISFTTGTFNWAVIKQGVLSWENLLDANDKPITVLKASNGEILDQSLNLLPLELITEIANVIVSISKDPDNADIYLGKVEDISKDVSETPKGK